MLCLDGRERGCGFELSVKFRSILDMSNGEALGSRNTCITASLGSELHDTSRRRLLCQVQTVSRASEPAQAIGDSWVSDWHNKSSQNLTSQAASLPHSESQHHSLTPSPGIEITSKNLGEDRDDAQERKSALLEPSGVGQTASTATRTSPHQHNTYTLHQHLQAAQNKFPPVDRQQVPGCGAPSHIAHHTANNQQRPNDFQRRSYPDNSVVDRPLPAHLPRFPLHPKLR